MRASTTLMAAMIDYMVESVQANDPSLIALLILISRSYHAFA